MCIIALYRTMTADGLALLAATIRHLIARQKDTPRSFVATHFTELVNDEYAVASSLQVSITYLVTISISRKYSFTVRWDMRR